MASIGKRFEAHPWRSLVSLALVVAGIWILGGWLEVSVSHAIVPFSLVIAGAVLASNPLPGRVVTGLLIMILGLFIGLRMAGIMEVPWLRYIISFVLIADGIFFFLSDDEEPPVVKAAN